jgi:hypothetical protein
MGEKLVVRSEDELVSPYRPVLRGKDIGPYQLNWDNMWVRYDRAFADKSQGEYCFLREERIFTRRPKILTRQTADRIMAAWDESGYYAMNTLHVTIPRVEGMDLKCLLALYNSKLLNYYYRLVFPDTERLFPQVKTMNVERLPLPALNGESGRLKRLADTLLESIRSGKVNGHCEKALNEIDRLVYQLYGLKPDQVARVERSPYTSSLSKFNRR